MINQQSKNIFAASTSTVRFFKIITTQNIQDGKIRLPKGFTTKHANDMLNPIFLMTPDDKKWEIHITKVDEDFWFQKGWKEFATYYSLDHGNMILFQFEEKSHFVVHVFGKSTLEIQYLCRDNQHEQNNIVQSSDEDSVEILNTSNSSKKKIRQKSPILCPQPIKKLRNYTNEGVGTSTKFQISDDTLEGDGKDSKLSYFSKHYIQANDENIEGNPKCQKEEQEEQTSKINEAINRARNFKSEKPYFTIVMKSSHLSTQILHVPIIFTKKYMKKGKSDILLQLMDGRTWDAKFYFGKINVGWKKFVADNKLKIGDVCVFELIESKDVTFKVLIFQLEQESHLTLPRELVQREKDRVREKNTSESKKFESLMERTKETTENVELYVASNMREVLIGFYCKILHEIQKIPKIMDIVKPLKELQIKNL
ncbi:unnamed protein product [Vicia faba]|uniref:TF-B3 domain-containing protein n=1 Tax=Vicia faba TaxID=3906 RepID=A0AAV1A8M5_VICFA|nr:unnamed protein product [Vicia faba]